MYSDILLPNGNEKDFIEMAERLGYKCLVFAYKNTNDIPQEKPSSKIRVINAVIANETEIQKAKRTGAIVLVKSTGNDRHTLEKSEADIMFGFEEAQKKDFMHHRASGLNHILCRIAAEKGKAIAFCFSSVLGSKGMLRAQIIGRAMQNVRLFRKFKVKIILASFAKDPFGMRAPSELIAFGVSIGMHPKMAKESLGWVK